MGALTLFCRSLTAEFQPFNFSQSYFSGESVSWKIVAPAGHLAYINLTSLSIAMCGSQPEKCKCRSLTVKRGECSNSSAIGKYCGKLEKPIILSSEGRYLRLEYQNDNEDNEDDFTAIYAAGSASRQSDRTVRNFSYFTMKNIFAGSVRAFCVFVHFAAVLFQSATFFSNDNRFYNTEQYKTIHYYLSYNTTYLP